MGGFSDKVVGGVGKLIRAFIQSPNYAQGVAGWTINRDGSAEFNSATFRGTIVITAGGAALFAYDPAPGLGNLVLSISSIGGIDPYGNNYYRGITTFAGPSGGSAGLISVGNSGGPDVRFEGNLNSDAVIQAAGNISLIAGGRLPIQAVLDMVFTGASYKFGSGPAGAYYYEEVDLSAQVIPTGAGTVLTGLTASVLESDYGSKFNLATGVWTCPVSTQFLFTASAAYTAWVANSRSAIYAHRTTSAVVNNFLRTDYNSPTTDGGVTVSGKKFMAAGDTVRFVVVQSTGANKTIAIGDERSFISIERSL